MRSIVPKLLVVPFLMLLTSGAFGQARLDFVHPVAGGTMEIVIDQVPPDAEVLLALGDPTTASLIDRRRADASGTVRFRYPVPTTAAGETIDFTASVETGEVAVAGVTIDRPQLVVTVESDGRASLVRVAVEPDRTFLLLSTRDLGSGAPGGAVRDGQRTKTFVVADRARGELAVVPDDPRGVVTRHPLAADVRDVTITPDGRFVLVSSGGADGTDGHLVVFDARTETPLESLLIAPLGPSGGKIVVSEDGLRAFVSVQGLYLVEIDLLRREVGDLIGVGGPGQDEIKDLRLVDGRLFALTGRSDAVGYLTGLEVDDLRRAQLEGPTRTEPRMGVANVDGQPSLMLLDAEAGRVTVLDAATMTRRTFFSVPAGAEALLFSPNPERTSGALLGLRGVGTLLTHVDFETRSVGRDRFVDRRLEFVSVHGQATRIDLLFARDVDGGLVLLDPETLAPLPAPPLAGLPVRAVSVAD